MDIDYIIGQPHEMLGQERRSKGQAAILRMFGVTEDGHSVCVHVHGFEPYFYAKVPDSFADGGHFLNSGSAVDHALRLADEGAEIIDIGGESTRPGSAPVSEEEELLRVVPVIERLAKRSEVALSVDTQKPVVAKAALDAGASIVNDVAANRESPQMWHVVAEAGAGYICMHMRGTPQTMQAKPRYDDVVLEVGGFFKKRLARLAEHGVSDAQVALDPGM